MLQCLLHLSSRNSTGDGKGLEFYKGHSPLASVRTKHPTINIANAYTYHSINSTRCTPSTIAHTCSCQAQGALQAPLADIYALTRKKDSI